MLKVFKWITFAIIFFTTILIPALLVESSFITRDLINTPTEDLSPSKLADYCKGFAKKYNAEFRTIKGKELIKDNFPAIHAVGRASKNEPYLIHFLKFFIEKWISLKFVSTV